MSDTGWNHKRHDMKGTSSHLTVGKKINAQFIALSPMITSIYISANPKEKYFANFVTCFDADEPGVGENSTDMDLKPKIVG